MSIAEAALYGDLVRYLRDRWAEQAAEFNESAFSEEQARINELIREWFFTPQRELHGFCPRDVIRNEEQGKPNVIPHDHLDDVFVDDCPLCEMMREETLSGEGSEWHFGLAPDMSLLDEYDPEGYDARWAAPARDQTLKPEARGWLKGNPNPRALAGNRFRDTQDALGFVNYLYELGAVAVRVDNIFDEAERIAEYGGPYADTLLVELPGDSDERAALYRVFEHELGEQQGLDLSQYEEPGRLIFWWD